MGTENQPRKRIAMYWAASCGGCDISLLEIGPKLLDLVAIADVVFWPCATDFKYADVAQYPDDHIDYCFFNGAIRNSEQERIARLLRQKSKTLVAYGACATDGGIPALANTFPTETIYSTAYLDGPSTENPDAVTPRVSVTVEHGELEIPEFYERVLTLLDIVPVDYVIPGCPPQEDRVWEAIGALASGAVPPTNVALKVGCTGNAVCDECPLEKRLLKIERFQRPHELRPEPDWCLLEQGLICMGAATRSGCGALCLNAQMPCRGCFGPSGDVRDQGAAMIGMLGGLVDADTEERARELVDQIADPLGTFYRFGVSGGDIKGAPLPETTEAKR